MTVLQIVHYRIIDQRWNIWMMSSHVQLSIDVVTKHIGTLGASVSEDVFMQQLVRSELWRGGKLFLTHHAHVQSLTAVVTVRVFLQAVPCAKLFAALDPSELSLGVTMRPPHVPLQIHEHCERLVTQPASV